MLEKARVYAPVRRTSGIDWKELNAGACKVMQDYCAAVKSETLLKLGLKWFDEVWRGEAASTFARNPHELVRVLEVFNIITNGEMIMEGCRARKAGNAVARLHPLGLPGDGPAGLAQVGHHTPRRRHSEDRQSGARLSRRLREELRRRTRASRRREMAQGQDDVRMFPNTVTPGTPVVFDEKVCNGCNVCVERCVMDIFMPNPEKGKPPIILYPDEC